MRTSMKALLALALAAAVCAGAVPAFADETAEESADLQMVAYRIVETEDLFSTFQKAVDAVQTGQTISTDAPASDMTAVVSREVSFTVTLETEGELVKDISLSAGDEYGMKVEYPEGFSADDATEATYTFGNSLDGFVRLAGSDRLGTMYEIAKRCSLEGAAKHRTAIVCTSQNFPDALAASALAGIDGGSIVLTDPSSLSAQTTAALELLDPQNIVIVGGTSAVSMNVQNQLSKSYERVSRIAGDDRYATAEAIYTSEKFRWSTTCIIATGENYADALSISPLAYARHMPIFLAQGGDLPESTYELLKNAGFEKVIIVGGTAAVSETVSQKLEMEAYNMSVYRWSDVDRYGTSVDIARKCIEKYGMTQDSMVVATGTNFPDALCGSVLAGRMGSVMVLVNSTATDVGDAIYAPASIYYDYPSSVPGFVLGGKQVVSSSMLKALNKLIVKG